MSISHLLKDFEFAGAVGELADDGDPRNSENFEEGYKAGWEDAQRAMENEKSEIGASLARNLQDLTFTYFEAKSAAVAEYEDVLEIILQHALPEIVHGTLGLRLAEELRSLAITGMSSEFALTANERDLAAINSILPEVQGVSTQAISDSDLPPGTVCWRVGGAEKRIDVTNLSEKIGQAVRGFVLEKKELKHA